MLTKESFKNKVISTELLENICYEAVSKVKAECCTRWDDDRGSIKDEVFQDSDCSHLLLSQ